MSSGMAHFLRDFIVSVMKRIMLLLLMLLWMHNALVCSPVTLMHSKLVVDLQRCACITMSNHTCPCMHIHMHEPLIYVHIYVYRQVRARFAQCWVAWTWGSHHTTWTSRLYLHRILSHNELTELPEDLFIDLAAVTKLWVACYHRLGMEIACCGRDLRRDVCVCISVFLCTVAQYACARLQVRAHVYCVSWGCIWHACIDACAHGMRKVMCICALTNILASWVV